MERFDALEWLRLVDRLKVQWAYMVPTMMSRVLALPEEVRNQYDISSLEMLIHMAAPCPQWVKESWIEWLGAEKVWEVYGGTEGYGATMIGGVEWLAHRGSVGRAPAGTSIRDDDGAMLPSGETGTVYFVPAENNPMGHPCEPRTFGDVGCIDAEGFLYLADRRTDMILTGGVNLYPAEIEGVIEQWPGVVASAVVGLPDADLGATAHAIVELGSNIEPPEIDTFAEFLRERLSAQKVPYSCEFTSTPLRDAAGKLKRGRLRSERLDTPRKAFVLLKSPGGA
jgi:bile acid-coenzyme A ligase